MIIEDHNIFTSHEKSTIQKDILGTRMPFFYEQKTTQEGYPTISHTIKRRGIDEIRSGSYDFFIPILKRFCQKHKLSFKNLLRAALNQQLYFPEKYTQPHVDHTDKKFYNVIMYLTNSDGPTYIFDKRYKKGEKDAIPKSMKLKVLKKIKAEQFKTSCFSGDYFHAVGHYSPDKRRVVATFTFN